MVQTLEVKMVLTDEISGAMRTARGTIQNTESALTSVGRQAMATAGGFIAAQASIEGARKAFDATIGAAARYEAQMAQIRALTGATKADTDQLDGAIKEMAKGLPKSPAELGAGAYFILSSGITDAADAAEVLEIAARASTVGLGETATVADALTTVLNAYNMEAGEAGRVTDILIQAVKDGKVEADGFASVLGTVVPVAAQMGVSFEEVAANLATFTRLGVDAETAATGLKGVLTQILKPSDEARELLGEMGMTFQDLREQIREKGLAATLQELMTLFEGNEEAISTLFPDVRGLVNVLGTAGVQADTYAQLVENARGATGNLDTAMTEVSDTAEFRFNMQMQQAKLRLQELGEQALPAATGGFFLLDKAVAVSAANWELFNGVTEAVLGGPDGFLERMKQVGVDAPAALEGASVGLKSASLSAEMLDIKLGGVTRAEMAAGREAIAMEGNLAEARKTIKDIEDQAGKARDALNNMFKEPTKEEQEAEAALAGLNLENEQLESGMGPVTDATREFARQLEEQGYSSEFAEARSRGLSYEESLRYQQLQTELIPAEDQHIQLLRAQRDAAETGATALASNADSISTWTARVWEQAGAVSVLRDALLDLENIDPSRIAALINALLGGRFNEDFNLSDVVATGGQIQGAQRSLAPSITINTQYPPTRGQVRDGIRDVMDEQQRAILTGG